MEMIFVYVKRPDEIPRHVWMSNTLDSLQRNVGGYIETVTLDENLVVICNEEGRLLGLPHNCEIDGIDFVGEIIIAGVSGEEFADCPLNIKDMKKRFPQLWEKK